MYLDSESEHKYSLLLTFKHPTINPSDISKKISLTPTNSWVAGEDRQTPSGRKLNGQNQLSLWAMVQKFEGSRDFFKSVTALLDHLEEQALFLNHISDTGGMASLAVQVPGARNIGSEIGWKDLGRFVSLKIDLGIEIFPDF